VLDEHLFVPVSLADATAAIGLSVGHASRAFAQTFGLSPHAYVVSRRVDRARRLLLDGASVAETAVDAGFHDQAHLTRHFHRHVGTTPACFRGGNRPRGDDSPRAAAIPDWPLRVPSPSRPTWR
jgi:AraC-like DNA-binding protein